MLPLLRPRGPFNSSPVDLPLFAALAIVLLAWSQRSLRMRAPYAFAVGLLLLGGALGALTGPVPGNGLIALLQDLPVFAFAAAVATVTTDASARRAVLMAWAYGSLAWAALMIVGVVTGIGLLSGIGDTYGSRASLTTGDPNAAANYFLLSIFVGFAAGVPRRRVTRVAALILLVSALVLTGSNGAVLALAGGILAATVVHVAVKHGGHPVTVLTLVSSLLLLLLVILPTGEVWNGVVDSADRSDVKMIHDSIGRGAQSTGSRMELLAEAEGLYTAGSVLGEGPASTKARLQQGQAPFAKEAHSDYTASLIERGIIGLFGLFLLLAGLLARVWGTVARPNTQATWATPGPASALLGAAVAVVISAAFYEVLHFRQEWLLFGIIASTAAASQLPPPRRASPPDVRPVPLPVPLPGSVPASVPGSGRPEEGEAFVVQVQRLWRVSTGRNVAAEIQLSADADGRQHVILELPDSELSGRQTFDVATARALAHAVLEACDVVASSPGHP